MGTRSTTVVYQNDVPIINLYRQYDGYPSGHGIELAEFLNEFEALTNGIQYGETRRTANGMGCLAAQMVAHFKQSVGGFYLHPVSVSECGQDYEYHVYADENKNIRIRVTDRGNNLYGMTTDDKNEMIFDGTAQEFLVKYAQEVEEQ